VIALARRANFYQTSGMNRRRRRARLLIRFRWVDILIFMALLAVMISALIRWPDKALADVALPTAFLVAFVWWREH
jgi:hypothetical protein